jgi:hypothetical protein
LTWTVTVSAVTGSGTPAGIVHVTGGGFTFSGALDGSGRASFSPSGSQAPGSYVVQATYDGDANFAGSSQTEFVQTVSKGNATAALISSKPATVVGESVTFTATVAAASPATGTPTGTVTFKDGASTLGTGTLSSGSASFSTSSLTVGSHTITAVYAGDGNFSGATSSGASQTVNKGATATALVASPSPSKAGQAVTFTATVTATSPASGTPSGTVTFKDGASTLGTGTLNGSGIATFTTSSLSSGGHTIKASYRGSTTFAESTSSVLAQAVGKGATKTVVAASPNPSDAGHAVTFSVTVTAMSPASGTPTGTVKFKIGAAILGSATLSGGSATLRSSVLTAGEHDVVAIYEGNDDFNSSRSRITQIVNSVETTTILASSSNPSEAGDRVTLRARVKAKSPASGTPTGTVRFKDGSTTLGSASLAGGSAVFRTTTLTAGSHAITAVYDGDGNFDGSVSEKLRQVVNPATTETVVTSSDEESRVGQRVVFTAAVSAKATVPGQPSGTVTFKDGRTTLGTRQLSDGTATYAASDLAIGKHSISATYNGATEFADSASSVLTQTVERGLTNTSLLATTHSDSTRTVVRLIATISVKAPAKGEPLGTVRFAEGSKTLGDVKVKDGRAALKVTDLTPGRHKVRAWYQGSADFAASRSIAVEVSVGSQMGEEFLVNSYTPDAQERSSVATLADGGFVVGWQSQGEDGSGFGIFGQRYDASGKRSGREFRLNTHFADDQTMPSLVGLGDGGFVAVWVSANQDGAGSGIYGQMFAADGSRKNREFTVGTFLDSRPARDETTPRVAALADGGFVVVWAANGKDGSGSGIFGQRFDAAGERVGTELGINTTVAGDQVTPSVATLDDGGFIVAWASKSQDGSGFAIYGQRFDADGNVAGDEFNVPSNASGDQRMPAVAEIDGGFVVVWTSKAKGKAGSDIFGQRFTATGRQDGDSFRINVRREKNQVQPSVTASPDGGFAVVWASDKQDGSGFGIAARRFNSEGETVDPDLTINETTTNDQWQPSVAAFSDGRLVVTWTSFDQDGSQEGVYGRLVGANENEKGVRAGMSRRAAR